ncbi:MAG: hypothetical protein RBR59_00390 [Sulfurimonadaceae bacterium]|nr:hypothetical protein [Sulfurimonadaceae bacterium]
MKSEIPCQARNDVYFDPVETHRHHRELQTRHPEIQTRHPELDSGSQGFQKSMACHRDSVSSTE